MRISAAYSNCLPNFIGIIKKKDYWNKTKVITMITMIIMMIIVTDVEKQRFITLYFGGHLKFTLFCFCKIVGFYK